MLDRNKAKTMLVLSLLMAGLACFPAQAQARSWGRGHERGYPHHERYPYGRFEVSLPHGFVELGFRGHKYFYNAGLFYLFNARQYVVVPPPAGVVVYEIPNGWHTVVIDGATYYTYNGVYYARVPGGYQVVQPPAPVIVEPAMVAATVVVAEKPIEEFTINIPNSKGNGYVTVVVKRSGTGFVGPQGEFYPEFPKVAQLQAMYAK